MAVETVPSNPLRILVGADVPPDPNSGAAGTVFQMNAALRRHGHIVDEFWSPDLGRGIQHGNLHYLLELPWKYRRAVRQRLRRSNFDVIELNQPHAYVAAADHKRQGRPGIFVNRSHGHELRSEEALEPWKNQFVTDTRGPIQRVFSKQIRRLLNRQWDLISRTADGFVVSCREDADFLVDRYRVRTERIGVITQGVPEAYLERETHPYDGSRSRRLLYVGQLAFFKAPAILGQAVSRILRRAPDATMTWVCGRGQHETARDLIDNDVRARVTFVDWMPQVELIDVFDRHGLFLFPSFFEGFGKAPLEAMSRGLCVIASEAGGMRDYIRGGQNGVLVPIGDPERMADAALRLLNEPETAQCISAAARVTALEHTWDRCASDVEAFYRQLIALRQRSSHAQ
jgi:glycosyltransferase involved in cell wall biosynthesis